MRNWRALIAAGAVTALIISLPATASAASGPPDPHDWQVDLVAPFSIAVDGHRVLIADGGTGVLGQLKPDGSIDPIVSGVPGLAGVAVRGARIAYGSTVQEGPEEEAPIIESGLNIRSPRGATIYADLHAYEYAHNPDGSNVYGITDPDSCAQGTSYSGLLDSHVYNVIPWRGDWLVADAGANAIMRVTDTGRISTFAVLPPVEIEITPMIAGMLGLEPCAIGDTGYVEPVPTGIAIGRRGEIYVSTLPGFPGMVTSQGALWRVDPHTRKATQVASGFSMPTSIAVSGKSIYVAEYDGGEVSVVRDGRVAQFAALPGVLSVATGPNGTVWAATMASETGPGTIYSIAKGKAMVKGHIKR